MAQQSARAQIIERRTYLRPTDKNGTKFETPEQAWARVIDHQRWLWERAQGAHLSDFQEDELAELYKLFMERKVTVSGRTRWLGGTDIAKTRESSQFNCSFTVSRTVHDVVDTIWLLLQGCGVGFRADVGTLNGFNSTIAEIEIIRSKKVLTKDAAGTPISDPALKGCPDNREWFDKETGVWHIIVGDSAEAWAKFFGKLLAFKKSAKKLIVDFSDIRPAGYRLSGYGWISSGDEQIAKATKGIFDVLNRAAGKLLNAIDILDVENHLGTILSSRRSAEIALYEYGGPEWKDFAVAKKDNYKAFVRVPAAAVYDSPNSLNPPVSTARYGDSFAVWDTKECDGEMWHQVGFDLYVRALEVIKDREHRQMSNNSLVFYSKPTRRQMQGVFKLLEQAGGSEPGFINGEAALKRAPHFKGVNPCAEILLGDKSFCNLVETAVCRFNGNEEGLHRAHWLVARANYRQTCVNLKDGVLQETWHELNEFLRLCGVGVTGVVGWEFAGDKEAWQDLRQVAWSGCTSIADELGLPHPKLVTTVKPSGCLPLDATIITDHGIQTVAEIMQDHDVGAHWTNTAFTLPDRDGGTLYATKTFDNGISEVVDIATVYNLPLASTPQHKWRLKDGSWVEAQNLKEGDELSIAPGLYRNETPWAFTTLNHFRLYPHGAKSDQEITQPEEMSDELAWFFGYLFGDGAMSPQKYRFRFVDAVHENLVRAKNVVKDVFGLDTPEIRQLPDRNAFTFEFGSAPLWRWVMANDMYKVLSEGVPKNIRWGSSRHVIAFIAGLFDADGCLTTNHGRRVATFTQACPEFVSSFQQTAWSVGLAFGRSENRGGQNKQKDKCIFLCTLSGHSTEKAVETFWSLCGKMSGVEVPEWNRNYAVKVKGISLGNFVDTADIEVEGEHRYFAFGGVETHNTQTKVFGLEGDEIGEGVHKPLGKYIFNHVNFSKNDRMVDALRAANYYVFDHPTDASGVIARIPVDYSNIPFDKALMTINGEEVEVDVNLETAVSQLDRYKLLMDHYVDHNCSVTVSYDITEVPAIIDWLMENWDVYVGVSFIYRNDPTKTAEDLGYAYLPQAVTDEKTFRAYADTLLPVNFDGTESEEVFDDGACEAGGACPIR